MDSMDLIEACLNQEDEKMFSILKKGGVDLEHRDSEGRTALYIAAQNGYYNGLKLLLSKGANVNAKNDTGFSPLHIAAENGNIEELDLLLDHNADVNNRENNWGSYPLLCASLWGYAPIVERLLNAKADASMRAYFDYSALSIACLKGFEPIVQKLLRHGGSDIELRNVNGATPLLLAAGSGNTQILQPLIEHGAHVNVQDKKGFGLLHILARTAPGDMITSLITKHRVDFTQVDEAGNTALHVAVTENNINATKALVRAGGNANAQNKHGNSPLHIAASKGYVDILSYLVTVGLDADLQNIHDLKPIDCAYLNKHSHLVEMLKRVSTLSEDIDSKEASLMEGMDKVARSNSAPIPAPRLSRQRTSSIQSLPAAHLQSTPELPLRSLSFPVNVDTQPPSRAESVYSLPLQPKTSPYSAPVQSNSPKSTLHNRKKSSGMEYETLNSDYLTICGNQQEPLAYVQEEKSNNFDTLVPSPSSLFPPSSKIDVCAERKQTSEDVIYEVSRRKASQPFLETKPSETAKGKRKGGFVLTLPNIFKPITKKNTEKDEKCAMASYSSPEFQGKVTEKIKELDEIQISPSFKRTIADVFIPFNQLVLGDLIGRELATLSHLSETGNFGRVYAGHLKQKSASQDVAVKTAKFKADDSEMMEMFLKEAIMMKDLQHMHVLNLIGITFDLEKNPMAIIPFMAHGNLRAYIRDPGKDLSVKSLLKLGLQVGRGMQYLALKKFIHRDLACRNCMIDESLIVKVADFGLSRDLYSRDYYRISDKSSPLPVRWMAPESLREHKFVQKSDVWSFGVLLWELLTRGTTPYDNVENWDIGRYIGKGHRLPKPEYCPQSVYDVMQSCWQTEPEQRPGFENIVMCIENNLHDITFAASTKINPADHLSGKPVYFV